MIRSPRAGDGDGLARCWLDAAAYYAALDPDADGLAPWLEERALSNATGDRCVLVAEADGQVVGYVVALQHPSPAAARNFVRELGKVRVYVDLLVVGAAYRRRGIGTRLMDAVEGWARSRDAEILLLDTYIGSDLSVPFYERRTGYTRRALRFSKTL